VARNRSRVWSDKTPNVPSLAEIEQSLSLSNLATAINQIQQHHSATPSPASAELFRKCLGAYLQEAIDRNDPGNFDRFWTLADRLRPDAPLWPMTLANLQAKFGRYPAATTTLPADAPPEAHAVLLQHHADWCVRFRSYAGLPDEHHGGLKAVILAFAKYEKGNDDEAREELNPIGLSSPFLEWKLLLRGLIAHANAEAAKAAENWQRLHPDRIPARLAAPLRLTVDPAFEQSLPPQKQSSLRTRSAALVVPKHLKALENVRSVVGPMQPLAQAWRDIEAARVALQSSDPGLVNRFRDVIYSAIIHQGEPKDVERFLRIFGSVADDPQFFRLIAMATENLGQWPDSIQHWDKYERWLATKPPGWDAALLAKARGIVLMKLGELAATLEAENANEDEDAQMFRAMLDREYNGRRPRKSIPKTSAAQYYEKAAAQDPTNAAPLYELALERFESDDFRAAEAAVRRALERQPQHQPSLQLHAAFRRATANNPLDENWLGVECLFIMAYTRRLLAAGKFDAIPPLMATYAEVLSRRHPVTVLTLQCTLARLAQNAAALPAIEAKLAALPHGRLAALFSAYVYAVLTKHKPALKTAANKALTAALAGPVTSLELHTLLLEHINLDTFGIPFTGQKTFLAKLSPKLGTADGSLADMETLIMTMARLDLWKVIKKHLPAVKRRHSGPSVEFLQDLVDAMTRKSMILPYRMTYDAELSARTDAFGDFYREMKEKVNRTAFGSGIGLDDLFDLFGRG
jgi:tetratricopeptide (TPR) repeat protein